MMDEEIRQAVSEVREMKQMCGNINMKLINIVTQRGQDWKKKLEAEYQRGLHEGNDIGYKDGVNDGRNEAWEAARKIVLSPDEGGTSLPDLFAMFGNGSMQSVFRNYSASEAIAKLKAYEEKQEADEDDKIEVGDVVRLCRHKVPYIVTSCDGDDDTYILMTVNGGFIKAEKYNVRKTGRHFDIQSILEAMKA